MCAQSLPYSQVDYQRIREHLASHGQEHVLEFWSQLDEIQRANLLDQCELLPLEMLSREVESWSSSSAQGAAKALAIEPATVVHEASVDAAHFREVGEAMIRAGRIACFTVAGGQGTRLGWNGPKGTFPAAPITGKSLFQLFAESILAARRRWGGAIPWYIMTSPLNHDATQDFFRANDWFQLGERSVRCFAQGTLPSLSPSGKILLAARGQIALNPDGHGGAIRALNSSGALAEMQREGVDTLSYFQVDNPLVKAVDPLFLGLHDAHPESSGEVSSKVVAKRDAAEKVGVFCRRGKQTMVMEYSDLPADLAAARSPSGALIHHAGSIAIHVFSRAFLQGLSREGAGLPLHRANKSVVSVDMKTGEVLEPATPNAVKLEAFIFDAVPLATNSLVYETRRDEEFAPIKNAAGEDSAQSSQRAQSERAARWMEECGIAVPRDPANGESKVTLEISALTALDPRSLASSKKLPRHLEAGMSIVL